MRHCRRFVVTLLLEFQFTHPGKGATGLQTVEATETEFQFTHPGKGATVARDPQATASNVSIHAPWEGCDNSGDGHYCEKHGFQFTHPGKGATHYYPTSNDRKQSFNSRTLGRVRHYNIDDFNTDLMFQFTHPGKGATQAGSQALGGANMFQFTHPGKGATPPAQSHPTKANVSIHAPWEGCDFAPP